MALGSSAPEILLSVIETCQALGSTPGELGPSTIVGSAAFNLMVISAVSVMAVSEDCAKNVDETTGLPSPGMPPPGVKKILDTSVFAITAFGSVFAYVWLYIVLEVNSRSQVEMWEAFLTLGFFFILVGFAFLADRNTTKKQNLKEHNIPPYKFSEIMDIIRIMQSPAEEKKIQGDAAVKYQVKKAKI
jgi:solute carrier family 8 (sodium/calcium exchanger)